MYNDVAELLGKLNNDKGAVVEALEAMIDATSAALVLDAFMQVCNDKAEHVATNWQDAQLAREWSRLADRVAIGATRASEAGL